MATKTVESQQRRRAVLVKRQAAKQKLHDETVKRLTGITTQLWDIHHEIEDLDAWLNERTDESLARLDAIQEESGEFPKVET